MTLSDNQLALDGAEFRINEETVRKQEMPAVAVQSDGSYLVVWANKTGSAGIHADDNADGSYEFEIWGQYYNADGTKHGGYFQVFDTDALPSGVRAQNPAVVALNNGNYVITYDVYEYEGTFAGASNDDFSVFGVIIGPELTSGASGEFDDVVLITGPFWVNDGIYVGDQSVSQIVALTNGGFAVVLEAEQSDQSGRGIVARIYDSNGVPQGPSFLVNEETVNINTTQRYPDIAALSDDRFVVVWQSEKQDAEDDSSGEYGIFGRIITGNAEDGLILDGMTNDEFNGTIFLRVEGFDGSLSGPGPDLELTEGTGYHLYVSAEGHVIAYDEDQEAWGAFVDGGISEEVATDAVSGIETNSETGLFQPPSASTIVDYVGGGVDEFQIHTSETDDQYFPSVTTLSDGSFVVVWISKHLGGRDAFAQIFDSDGDAVGTEFQVNTSGTDIAISNTSIKNGEEYNPFIRVYKLDEGFFAVWQSSGEDGDGAGIFARRFDGDGAGVGDAFQVNTNTVNDQFEAEAALLDSDTLLVLWTSDDSPDDSDANASETDVSAQLFSISALINPPTVSGAPSDATVVEETATAVDLSGVSFADVDNDTLTVTLTTSAGTVASTDGDGTFDSVTVANSGTGAMTLSGTAAAINSYLDTTTVIEYTGATNVAGADAATLTLSASDGNGGSLASDPVVNLDITNTNDAPTVSGAPSDATVVEYTSTLVDLSGMSFGDVDGDTLTVTLAADVGSLTASDHGGVTVAGSGTGTLTLSGAVGDLNSYLDVTTHIHFTGPEHLDGDGAATLTVSAADSSGATLVSDPEISVNITEASVAPTITGEPSEVVVAEDITGSFDLSDLVVSDPFGAGLTVTLFVSDGSFATPADGAGVGAGVVETLVNNQTITLAGTAGDITTYLDTTSNITYTAPENTFGLDLETLTISAVDDDGLGFDSNPVIGIDVTAVNDIPVLSGGATLEFSEGDGASVLDATVAISDIDDTNLDGASVQITDNYQSGFDVLAFESLHGITAQWTSATGLLTLSGTATLAQYQEALRSVTFDNTSYLPDADDRTVTFTVNDGSANSDSITSTVEVTDTPFGSVSLSGDAKFTEALQASVTGFEGDTSDLSYVWLRNGSAISGATSASYRLLDDDIGAQISLRVSYDAGEGPEELTTAAQTVSNPFEAAISRHLITETDAGDEQVFEASWQAPDDGEDRGLLTFVVKGSAQAQSDSRYALVTLGAGSTLDWSETDGSVFNEAQRQWQVPVTTGDATLRLAIDAVGSVPSVVVELFTQPADQLPSTSDGVEYLELQFGADTPVYRVHNGDIKFDEGEGPANLVGDDQADEFVLQDIAEVLALAGGADVVTVSGTTYSGDAILDFDVDDSIVFSDNQITADDVTVEQDGTLVIQGAGASEALRATLADNAPDGQHIVIDAVAGTTVRFDQFLPTLQDGERIGEDVQLGVVNQLFLTGTGSTDFQVTVEDLGVARHNNVMGIYEVDENGAIVDVDILFDNMNANVGDQAQITSVEAGHELGFFLVQNGANWASSLAQSDVFEFKNQDSEAANLTDGSDLALNVNGQEQDLTIFHSYRSTMNSDGETHVVSGLSDDGSAMLVSFEDLMGLGDADYEDAAIRIEIL